MTKKLIQLSIPIVALMYFILSGFTGVRYTVQVLAICVALNLLYNLYLKVDQRQYDGKIVIGTSENGKKLFSLELDGDPEELEPKSSVTFKIVSPNE
jgi:hypothetical protein